ncbi:hypothetical protein BN2475_570053 [Paraburkholderia ribeironis]|uniref:Uncharacterized protein n=1 Tax=Paraburkholderia ribeironis TaxID=1247936 RepID=A0A1N7SDZ1_9BURK|nr:hypothetical protein BN2475_570053 [Paraburkholderia ribeironis]
MSDCFLALAPTFARRSARVSAPFANAERARVDGRKRNVGLKCMDRSVTGYRAVWQSWQSTSQKALDFRHGETNIRTAYIRRTTPFRQVLP